MPQQEACVATAHIAHNRSSTSFARTRGQQKEEPLARQNSKADSPSGTSERPSAAGQLFSGQPEQAAAAQHAARTAQQPAQPNGLAACSNADPADRLAGPCKQAALHRQPSTRSQTLTKVCRLGSPTQADSVPGRGPVARGNLQQESSATAKAAAEAAAAAAAAAKGMARAEPTVPANGQQGGEVARCRAAAKQPQAFGDALPGPKAPVVAAGDVETAAGATQAEGASGQQPSSGPATQPGSQPLSQAVNRPRTRRHPGGDSSQEPLERHQPAHDARASAEAADAHMANSGSRTESPAEGCRAQDMNAAQQVCQSAAAAAAEPKHPSPRKRKHLHRVQFAEGPLKQVYGTQDGHPDHEGLTARAVRDNGASWPLDLTAHNVRMLEVELGEACRPSLDRLKRRVGLLPAVKRQRIHVTPNNRSPATERRTSQSVLRALKTDTVVSRLRRGSTASKAAAQQAQHAPAPEPAEHADESGSSDGSPSPRSTALGRIAQRSGDLCSTAKASKHGSAAPSGSTAQREPRMPARCGSLYDTVVAAPRRKLSLLSSDPLHQPVSHSLRGSARSAAAAAGGQSTPSMKARGPTDEAMKPSASESGSATEGSTKARPAGAAGTAPSAATTGGSTLAEDIPFAAGPLPSTDAASDVATISQASAAGAGPTRTAPVPPVRSSKPPQTRAVKPAPKRAAKVGGNPAVGSEAGAAAAAAELGAGAAASGRIAVSCRSRHGRAGQGAGAAGQAGAAVSGRSRSGRLPAGDGTPPKQPQDRRPPPAATEQLPGAGLAMDKAGQGTKATDKAGEHGHELAMQGSEAWGGAKQNHLPGHELADSAGRGTGAPAAPHLAGRHVQAGMCRRVAAKTSSQGRRRGL